MATFGKTTFNAAKYATSRLTYPRALYDFVFKFHEHAKGARSGGQATVELTRFQCIIGVDLSARMIKQARENVKLRLAGLDLSSPVEFVQASAEALPVEQGSVDFIVAAQAYHWFNWNKVWPEVARALRKDGTFAAWGYSGFRLSGFPSATPLINDYRQGSDPVNSLGPYWERPGSTILDGHLVAVPDPREALPSQFNSEFERIYFTAPHYPDLAGARPVVLRKALTWTELLGFLRTWSPLHTFHEAHPADLERADGDIAVRFWRRLKEEVGRAEGKEVPKDEDVVNIKWPMALLLARKA
ncbi:S-adenosyl-L-methionine-dependent methyltransferase [Trametes versicolor FP-101664 SS1]|uniref:S-adenosyl-L-methionine-dependent methyltransferase n=1 Tax=Trametes versicolor (strain FP-101664) TaxID=717944 RepID=UPI0004622296|nr:S-adenosyl-L-methionine-dependent methyltransferase [Trametes versicolor FP-101664 SS1]EIW55807.1 S-adenosyl-L-methionine-dependent methyltransferase [Trametes versicolor FP-101664 SS1]